MSGFADLLGQENNNDVLENVDTGAAPEAPQEQNLDVKQEEDPLPPRS